MPFHEISPAEAFIEVVNNEGRPQHPQAPVSWGLTDDVWNLIQSCWVSSPDDRPEMATVVGEIENIRHQMNELNLLENGRRSHQLHETSVPVVNN